jgi:hypothetical protein
MHLPDEKIDLNLKIQFTITFTVFFAASWCLSQGNENLVWLCISRDTYLKHLAIWSSLGILVFVLLYLVGKKSYFWENKVIIFLFIISFINIFDYGMRSIFGQISDWNKAVLISWSLITLLYPVIAIFCALKFTPSRHFIKVAMQICVVPALLFILYAVPPEFTILKVEKPIQKGNRTPIHLIVFDMLSYDFIFQKNKINYVYKNLSSFSNQADVYHNAFSPAGNTRHAIARLTTGIDFESIEFNINQLNVKTKDSVETKKISSYESIFSFADKWGYNVFLRAFALPYLNNFGEHIQSGITHPFDSLWRSGMHSLIWPVLSPGGIQHQKTTIQILDDYVARINSNPRNTFFYTHWNIPHDPFIFNSEGKMYSRLELTQNLITKPDRKPNYKHQLIGTDIIFGKIIDALKNSGTYDESLIIVTSDHNIKGYGFDMKHIPLLVKRPYQNRSQIFQSEVKTHNLYYFIKYFIKNGKCKNAIINKEMENHL